MQGGNFEQFKARGNLNEGVVYEAWQKIWASDLARKYTNDFEVYGEGARDRSDAEVQIFIATQ